MAMYFEDGIWAGYLRVAWRPGCFSGKVLASNGLWTDLQRTGSYRMGWNGIQRWCLEAFLREDIPIAFILAGF